MTPKTDPTTHACATSPKSPDIDVATLYRRYGPMIFRRIKRFYTDNEAEEVLQEVFLRLLENIDSFRGDSSPSTWLYRMATNHCLNRLRINRRRRELLEEHAGELWYAPDKSANQEATLFLSQLWRQLSDELATIGVYYYVDGMTHAEIARVLGVSRRTVGNRIKEIEAHAQASTESQLDIGTPATACATGASL